jgi:hypothetical protein
MQNKLILGAILTLLLALASVPLALAGGGSGRDDDDVRILHLTTRTVQEALVDAPPSGESVGDRFVFSDNVFRGDEQVGVGGVDCVLVRFESEPEAATAHCVATLSLPKGQITAQGLIDFTAPGPFALAITGGTGAYRTAHGEVEVTEESPEVDRLKLTLILGDD